MLTYATTSSFLSLCLLRNCVPSQTVTGDFLTFRQKKACERRDAIVQMIAHQMLGVGGSLSTTSPTTTPLLSPKCETTKGEGGRITVLW